MYFIEQKSTGKRLGHGTLWTVNWGRVGARGRSYSSAKLLLQAVDRIKTKHTCYQPFKDIYPHDILIVELGEKGITKTPVDQFIKENSK